MTYKTRIYNKHLVAEKQLNEKASAISLHKDANIKY